MIDLEIELRAQSGESIDVFEYRNRFPHHSVAIQSAFSRLRAFDDVVTRTDALIGSGISGLPGDDFETGRPESIPEQLGDFKIGRKLGSGAFGIVHLATDITTGQELALKFPRRQRIRTQEELDSFRREAEAAQELQHRSIVRTYGVYEINGYIFIAQQYIAGGSLSDVKKNSLSQRRIAELIAGVSDGLAYAHQKGITHRDLKPSNIMLDADGNPLIVDFGLAVHESAQRRLKGQRCGTPAYMSPEQVNGLAHLLDGRSDIWSLGVIMYELLVNRRPFSGNYREELFEEITERDPKPPRMIRPQVDRELQRICLKCLCKAIRERYHTADELAHDLGTWLAGSSSPDGTGPTRIRVVPQGLRSFGAHDADVYQRLLPGPKDQDGLSESTRFWKSRIEAADGRPGFRVGVIIGPSGCGKSSYVKAGLLPHLSSDIESIFVEATSEDTESRLLQRLRNGFPHLPRDIQLPQLVDLVRDELRENPDRKLLIVIDQFEQWLHSRQAYEKAGLLQALQHSDADNLQCILLVRDDFWLRMSQFLYAMEIDFREGTNARRIDLFDLKHARKVLHEFGLAYHKLPELDEVLSQEQEAFLQQAVESIAEDNRVVCVRLALFAEMFRDKPWTVGELESVGGAAGIGETFLNETFASPDADMFFRRNEQPVRRVLGGLLPPAGENIRAHMRTHSYLLEQSMLPADRFDELMDRLDQDLRLVTPTDPNASGENENADNAARHFQLTHDYLVPSIREWLTGEQQRTKRGRAELRLKELSEFWEQKEDSNFLPGWMEYLSIRFRTRPKSWTGTQRRFMQTASRLYLARGAAMLLAMVVLGVAGWIVTRRVQADSLVNQLTVSQIAEVPEIAEQMKPLKDWVEPRLTASVAGLLTQETSGSQLSASDLGKLLRLKIGMVELAGIEADPDHVDDLYQSMLEIEPANFEVVRNSLHPHCHSFKGNLWVQVENEDKVLPAASALALYDANSERWIRVDEKVADALVKVPVTHIAVWMKMLRPVDEFLLPALTEIHADTNRRANERVIALEFIIEYQQESSRFLVEAIEHADPPGFEAIVAALSERADARELLQSRFQQRPLPDWNDNHANPEISHDLEMIFDEAGGLIEPAFAFCLDMPRDQFRRACDGLKEHGYRPGSVRLVSGREPESYSATWARDGLNFSTLVGNAREIQNHHDDVSGKGMHVVDIAVSADEQGNAIYSATWCQTEENETHLAIDLTEDEFNNIAESVAVTGYLRLERRCSFTNNDEKTHSGIWSKSENETVHFERPASDDPAFVGQRQLDLQPDQSEVWDPGITMASVSLRERDIQQHRIQAQQLINAGYRPHLIQNRGGEKDQPSFVSVWHRPATSEDVNEINSSRRANLTLAMLALDVDPDSAWRELESTDDSRTRSMLIHRLSEYRFEPGFLIDRLRKETTHSVRQALLLALGEFEASDYRSGQLQVARQIAIDEFQNNPDSGVHGAARWLLGQLGEENQLRELVDSLRLSNEELLQLRPDMTRRWYVSPTGHEMAVVEGGKFMFGCQPDDPEIGEDETLQWKLIDRTFAISMHELTRSRYEPFEQANDVAEMTHRPELRLEAPDMECPITGINWYEAAQYCNWLSEQEGIPEDQWCYEPNSEGKYADSMRAKPDYLSLKGYRLPTTAEWEFACRSGNTTSRFHGQTIDLLPEYAWFLNNSERRCWPVGALKPNGFGLFDMLGNYWELCQGVHVDEQFIDDVNASPLVITDERGDGSRSLRGGGFRDPGYEVRIANKMVRPAFDRDTSTTFRIVRTIPDP